MSSPPVPKSAGQPETVVVAGVALGTWHFGIKSVDAAGNWSALSNTVIAEKTDVPLPSRIIDLRIDAVTDSGITLKWTAPGSPRQQRSARAYDLRVAQAPITLASWEQATPLPGIPLPGPSGTEETYTTRGLPSGRTYYLAIRSTIEEEFWSDVSNVVEAEFPDLYAPAPIQDLEIVLASQGRVALRWTAPGNDGRLGRATAYDLRYSTEAIDDEDWALATHCVGVQAPDSSGVAQVAVVEGLEAERTYHFALKTGDGVPNWSPLSNVVNATITPPVLRQLTTYVGPGAGAVSPCWAPDDQSVGFVADWAHAGLGNLYIARVASGDVVQVTSVMASVLSPTWSPDGSRIAFASATNGISSLYIVDAAANSSHALVPGSILNVLDCAWSPDGAEIIFTANPYTADYPGIWRIPASGGRAELLVLDAPAVGGPAWSPDGTHLAYESTRGGSQKVWIWDLSTGEAHRLTSAPGTEGHPTWSPDGGWIAFQSDRTGDDEIWISRTTGAKLMQVTDDPADDILPAWSPAGDEIAFASARSGTYQIWVLHVR